MSAWFSRLECEREGESGEEASVNKKTEGYFLGWETETKWDEKGGGSKREEGRRLLCWDGKEQIQQLGHLP